MLEFINKYRNDPKRTVITIKINKCMSFAKLGELNVARQAKNNKNAKEDPLENANETCSDGSCSIDFNENESVFAFKPDSELKGENDYTLEGDDSMNRGNYEKNECECGSESCKERFVLPCATGNVKGGINESFTGRILLCDLVAGAVALGGMMLGCKWLCGLFNKKKR